MSNDDSTKEYLEHEALQDSIERWAADGFCSPATIGENGTLTAARTLRQEAQWTR